MIYELSLTDRTGIVRFPIYHVTGEAARDPIIWRYLFEKFEEEGTQDRAIQKGLFWMCHPYPERFYFPAEDERDG